MEPRWTCPWGPVLGCHSANWITMWRLSWMVSLSMVAKITGHDVKHSEGRYKLEMDVSVQVRGLCGSFDVIRTRLLHVTWHTLKRNWAGHLLRNAVILTARFPVMFGRWMIRFVVCSEHATLSKAQNKGKLVVSITAYDDSGDSATEFHYVE